MSNKVALIGATGLVGSEILSAMFESGFSSNDIVVLGGESTLDSEIAFGDTTLDVELLNKETLKKFDNIIFATPEEVSKEFVIDCLNNNSLVIDCSSGNSIESSFLSVPEINNEQLRNLFSKSSPESGYYVKIPKSIASTLTVALKPLIDKYGVKRIVLSTYQSLSNAGKKGMEELWEQTRAIYNQSNVVSKTFNQQIAFNCLPQIGDLSSEGNSKEEDEIISQVKIILDNPVLPISVTSVYVPVFSCHAMSVNLETDLALDSDSVRELFKQSPGIMLVDNPSQNIYPHGVNVVGSAAVHIGRVRCDKLMPTIVNMWIVVDNIYKSTAMSVVRILQVRNEC